MSKKSNDVNESVLKRSSMSKKTLVTIIAVVLAVYFTLVGVGAWFAYDLTYIGETHGELETFSVGDGTNVKVGIFSDSQLPASGVMTSHQVIALRATMNALKKENIDVLIMAGDFTDLATKEAWKSFQTVYDEVFGEDKPIASFVLGNHDYWLDWFAKSGEVGSPTKMQRRFMEFTGEKPFAHKVVNGYHFISWSMANGSYDKSYTDKDWIKAQLDKAVADDPTKPIFVTTHMNPSDTVYGSDDWGNNDITEMLKNYPQVISFSGHSHYALEDERSINQKDFTSINTQTIDYIEVEDGKYNKGVPMDAYGNDACYNPMAMIMNVTEGNVNIQRMAVDVNKGEFTKVQNPWVISAPFDDKTNFKYVNEGENGRIAKNNAPQLLPGLVSFEDAEGLDAEIKFSIKVLKFSAGMDDNFVHSYKLVFKNANNKVLSFLKTNYDGTEFLDKETEKSVTISELLYFSDFTKGIGKMSDTVIVRLPPNIPTGTTIIEITAIDSWGAESNPIEITYNA